MVDYVPISNLIRRDGSGGIVQEPVFVQDSTNGVKPAMLLGKNHKGQILIKTESSQGKPFPIKPNTLACRQAATL